LCPVYLAREATHGVLASSNFRLPHSPRPRSSLAAGCTSSLPPLYCRTMTHLGQPQNGEQTYRLVEIRGDRTWIVLGTGLSEETAERMRQILATWQPTT